LMRSSEGTLQYAAFLSEDLLAADPVVCSRQDLVLAQEMEGAAFEAPVSLAKAAVSEALEMKTRSLASGCGSCSSMFIKGYVFYLRFM